MNDRMRAATLMKPGELLVGDVPRPRLNGSGQLLLNVEACGVCGSDIPRMMRSGAHKMPLICGHEFSATVIDASDDVEGIQPGDLVTVPPLIPCFKCSACEEGQFSLCTDYDYFGSRRDGAYAEIVLAPVTNAIVVPKTMDPRAAAMADPAAIALHALWKTSIGIGKTTAIIGAGPIGLFAIQWAALNGSSTIVALDVSQSALDLARQAGATHVFTNEQDLLAEFPEGLDVVFEGAGVPKAENAAIRVTRRGGDAVFVGIPGAAVPIESEVFSHFLRQEIRLLGSWNSFSAPWPGHEWHVTIDALANGRLRWEFMITHELPLKELPETFVKLRDRSEHTSKVIFRPQLG